MDNHSPAKQIPSELRPTAFVHKNTRSSRKRLLCSSTLKEQTSYNSGVTTHQYKGGNKVPRAKVRNSNEMGTGIPEDLSNVKWNSGGYNSQVNWNVIQ